MLRVGIFGKTDSARRKAAIVGSSDRAILVRDTAEPGGLIEASDLIVLADGDEFSRLEMATNVLRRGRHVFSDWPIAADAASAKGLSQTAEESGVELAVNRPDRFHPTVLMLREKSPTLTDVTFSAGRHYRFENLLTDAVDLCLLMNGGSSVHRYEAEAVRDDAGGIAALSFALRFHTGSLALGRIRKADGPPIRTLFAAGHGWHDESDLLTPVAPSSKGYDPSIDEQSFISCLEMITRGQAVRTSLYELEETLRVVETIMVRMRGTA